MKPAALPLRNKPQSVCQLCDYALQRLAQRRYYITASTLIVPAIRRPVPARHALISGIPARAIATTKRVRGLDSDLDANLESNQQQWDRIAALKSNLAKVEEHIQWIKSSPKVESEAAVLQALEGLEDVARQAIAIRTRQPLPTKMNIRQSSASAILAMGREDGSDSVQKPKTTPTPLSDLPSPTYLSSLALSLIKHPKVFLSPNVLALYISFQRLVACPRAIPEALHLYAHKPVPELGSSPPKYYKPSPKAPKQAIPPKLADEALTAAIEAKDMPLALDVVEMSYCTPAWRRHRMVTKLGVPGLLAAITPLGLYMIAQELSQYSGYIDPGMFKLYSFLGMSTYVLCTGTLGFVALTTHNDNHNRVVWRPGMPLLDRYMREDERAAMDRIACAWGFKEEWRRGDEEGEEWEGLRQLILLRGMILDKPDLMPGMNA
ncbi:hypothetical protein DM02DRAFT_119223 [Periconia macrospinosa]|uniref:Uncharacterized protein n=1 Tax=Periconia macrospinosa TaxID=97972 RepID=A0A2V1DGT1_9PLEO|nr:hypothetical protein DM02DRAFT_119223 [Periconia macrospinosa]